MTKDLKEKIRKCLYQRMDSFLVEGDKPREIGRLNLDRHLFVDTTSAEILELFFQQEKEILEERLLDQLYRFDRLIMKEIEKLKQLK